MELVWIAQTNCLTALSAACHDGISPIREVTMRAQALAHKINLDRVDLDALDDFLRSDRSPPDSMMLSEVDGFLTGIAIGPELIRPSEWLPLIWGRDAPAFAALDEAQAILGFLMARYNEILGEIDDDAIAPIFWTGRDGAVIAMDWAEGFLEAIKLRIDAWQPLFKSKRDGKLLLPILSLCCGKDGTSLLELPPEIEDHMLKQAPELIPGCVLGIAAYWGRSGPKQMAIFPKSGRAKSGFAKSGFAKPGRAKPGRATSKAGRNDPCPCGSGRKFKRCCGQHRNPD